MPLPPANIEEPDDAVGGPGRLHPRHGLVERASIDLQESVVGVVQRHSLTHAELQNILIRVMASWNKWAVRDEREEELRTIPPGTARTSLTPKEILDLVDRSGWVLKKFLREKLNAEEADFQSRHSGTANAEHPAGPSTPEGTA
jgi:predicted transcriptional regulator